MEDVCKLGEGIGNSVWGGEGEDGGELGKSMVNMVGNGGGIIEEIGDGSAY